MYRNLRVIAVVPCLDEKVKIAHVIQRLQAISYLDEIVVVDDGSTDGSKSVIQSSGVTLLSFQSPQGVGAALRYGFVYARYKADVVVVLAGNNKDNPQEISRLLDPIVDKKASFVQGSRFLQGGGYGGDMPFYRKIATRLHPILFSLISGKNVSESTNGFRAISTEIFKDKRVNLDQTWLNEYELEPYLYYKTIKLGYSTCEVPVTKIYPPKEQGYTKMKPLIGWWSILRPLILLGLGVKR